MSTLTPPRNDDSARPEPSSRRGWLLNAVALAAVVVTVGLIATFGPLDSDVISPAATEPDFDVEIDPGHISNDQALETAQAYIDARNSYDVDRAWDMVADNFRTSEVPDAYTLDTMELAFEVHEAYGFNYAEGDGEVRQPDAGQRWVRVTCDSLWTTELQQITGYPGVPASFVFRIQDGLIVTVSHDWNEPEFSDEVYDPWLDFLDTRHPEFHEIALAVHDLDPAQTRTFIEQAPPILALYEEWVQDQAAVFPVSTFP